MSFVGMDWRDELAIRLSEQLLQHESWTSSLGCRICTFGKSIDEAAEASGGRGGKAHGRRNVQDELYRPLLSATSQRGRRCERRAALLLPATIRAPSGDITPHGGGASHGMCRLGWQHGACTMACGGARVDMLLIWEEGMRECHSSVWERNGREEGGARRGGKGMQEG
jgi:hypothetical protein